MTDFLIDQDPGDETQHPEATGLCARPWCDDAAIPDGEFCPECEGDVAVMLAEFEDAA